MSSTGAGLTALVVDDEQPALTDLGYLLGRDHRVAEVISAASGTDALAVLDERDIDVVFSDISMPGLDGMALARVISRFAVRPQVVFVTAHDEHAVDAFALAATDYVMKPVREDRLAEAIRRVVAAQGPPAHHSEDSDSPSGLVRRPSARDLRPARTRSSAARPAGPADDVGAPRLDRSSRTGAPSSDDDQTIPVELGGVTRFITRSQVRYAQAHGDYARLHTSSGSHLVRVPLSTLEEEWADHGFVRIHRSTLVALPHVREVRIDHGRCAVLVGDIELQVSRRHTKQLRDTLLRRPLGGRPPPEA
ncbi:MAG: LytR/AlgR family response regulator transcription factor [Phycicoccus sp.]